MKPGSDQNSSNLGLEDGVMRLNLLSFFPCRLERDQVQESKSERVHTYDLAEVSGV